MNCRRARFIRWVGLVLLLPLIAFGQQDTGLSSDSVSSGQTLDSLQNQDATVADTLVAPSPFKIPPDSVQVWRRGGEFGYMAYLDSVLKSHKGQFRTDTVHLGSRSQGTTGQDAEGRSFTLHFLNNKVVRIFFWVLAISFVIFLLNLLFISSGGISWKRKKNLSAAQGAEPLELDEYEAYLPLILEAESKGDLNLATRYLYLQTLKKLSNVGLIHFAPEKTDDQYAKELSGRNIEEAFRDLMMNYEYIWYGKFSIPLDFYTRLKTQFINLNQKL